MAISISVFNARLFALACIVALMPVNPAFADKPAWAGHSSGAQSRRVDHRPDRRAYTGKRDWDRSRRTWDRQRDWRPDQRKRPAYKGGRYFVDQHRTIIHNYYYDTYRGRCPPGFAKKGNRCIPPGHARTWAIGRPLPRSVVYYDVPQPVLIGLDYPPPGYRFVRVASDILLIAIGTGLVMDAIYDFGGGW